MAAADRMAAGDRMAAADRLWAHERTPNHFPPYDSLRTLAGLVARLSKPLVAPLSQGQPVAASCRALSSLHRMPCGRRLSPAPHRDQGPAPPPKLLPPPYALPERCTPQPAPAQRRMASLPAALRDPTCRRDSYLAGHTRRSPAQVASSRRARIGRSPKGPRVPVPSDLMRALPRSKLLLRSDA